MTSAYPQWFTWTDEGVMRPLNPRAADRQYVVGEKYRLDHIEERSEARHRAYFAALNECFANLPDPLAQRYGSPEGLRKHALIRTGWRDERSFACGSRAEAQRLAAWLPQLGDYTEAGVSGTTVVVLTPKSQSYRAMGKADFNKSMDDVLNYVASLIGTTADELNEAARTAA